MNIEEFARIAAIKFDVDDNDASELISSLQLKLFAKLIETAAIKELSKKLLRTIE